MNDFELTVPDLKRKSNFAMVAKNFSLRLNNGYLAQYEH